MTLTNWECGFGYRQSIFKSAAKDRYVVVGVTFRLRPRGAATIRYPELQTYLDEHGIDVHDLLQVREAVIAIRKRKGMVLDPTDPDTRSDGSFFMNPVVTPSQFDDLLVRAGTKNIPHFPVRRRNQTLRRLADRALRLPQRLHPRQRRPVLQTHAGGDQQGWGYGGEVLELVTMIQEGVREAFGVEIQPEPNFIGL